MRRKNQVPRELLMNGHAMPAGTTSVSSAVVILGTAFFGGLSALVAGLMEPGSLQQAADRAAEGVIWTGGTPVLLCIAGAVGGSIFSVGWELLATSKPMPTWKVCVKVLMQPLLAIAGTSPAIYWLKLPFTQDTILFVSFAIGALGVYLLRKCLPAIEARLISKIKKGDDK